MSGVSFRTLSLPDLDWLCEAEKRCFPGDPWSRAMLEGSLTSPGVSFFGAERDGALLGYTALQTAADEAEILNLAVLPEARCAGLGGRLLDMALQAARQRGAAHCYLEVRVSNEPAIRLYRSRNFVPVGRRKHYYKSPREDALVLCLPVRYEVDPC